MGAAALLLLHTLMRGSRGIPLPSLGTLGPGLMTPTPYKEGSTGRKGRRGPSPQQCLCLCAPLLPRKDTQVSAGLGQRGRSRGWAGRGGGWERVPR